jgi:DNA anti-recombination protein RmuC
MASDERFGRIEDKIDRLGDKLDNTNQHLSSVDKQLSDYNAQLTVHIEGTNQNRTSLRLLEEQTSMLREQFHKELEPVKKHINHVEGIFKFIMGLGAITTLIAGIMKILYYIKGWQ